MIARLAGIVDALERDRAVIDVGGVGYLVRASTRTIGALEGGRPAILLIETQVREDAIELYGFASAAERDWFRLLTTVQGVGAKVALSLLSALSGAELARAIASSDRVLLTRAEGVGPKLANRVTSELRDKVASLGLGHGSMTQALKEISPPPGGAVDDAVSALANLGYRRPEAIGAIEKASQRLGAEARVEALIAEGLKELAR